MIMAGWKDIRLIRYGKKFLSNFILNFFYGILMIKMFTFSERSV